MKSWHDEGSDVRELLEHASRSWRGPSRRSGQARWAADGEAPRRRAGWTLRLAAAGVCSGLVAVLLASGAVSSGDPVGSVWRLMAHVFAGPPEGAQPPPAPLAESPSVSPASPTPPTPSPARSGPRPTSRPEPSGVDHRRPSPGASPLPSPSPTDE